MITKIHAYNNGSSSASRLANSLGIRKLNHGRSNYRPRDGHVILNWGASEIRNDPLVERANVVQWLNNPESLGTFVNKKRFFEEFNPDNDNPMFLEWTDDHGRVMDWYNQGIPFILRSTLTGHSGEGITYVDPNRDDDDENVPRQGSYRLCTKYFKKKDEFRIHFFKGVLFFVQQKRKRNELEEGELDIRIRTHANGYNFCHTDRFCRVPEEVKRTAARFAEDCLEGNLDFGAIDILYNRRMELAKVIEVNTAPSLEGETTLEKYSEVFGYYHRTGEVPLHLDFFNPGDAPGEAEDGDDYDDDLEEAPDANPDEAPRREAARGRRRDLENRFQRNLEDLQRDFRQLVDSPY